MKLWFDFEEEFARRVATNICNQSFLKIHVLSRGRPHRFFVATLEQHRVCSPSMESYGLNAPAGVLDMLRESDAREILQLGPDRSRARKGLRAGFLAVPI